MQLAVCAYPGLSLQALAVELPAPLGDAPSPAWLVDLLRRDASAPVAGSEALRTAVRDLLRAHGYRPTGRGKPSSEYLVGAVAEGRLGSINPVVDAGRSSAHCAGSP